MPSPRLILCTYALAASACAQTPSTVVKPVFEAASVRPSKAGTSQQSNVPLDAGNVYGTVSADGERGPAGGYFVATHQALWRYISFAYKLSGTQELSLRFNMFSGAPKSGAPFWVTGSFNSAPEFFDISARAPANASVDDIRLMMQALLEERFHLATHTTTADASVFALTLITPGKPGVALQLHPTADACSTPDGKAATFTDGRLPPVCGVIAHVSGETPGQHYGGRAVPLSLLAASLPTMTGLAAMPRPVVDRTGLSGLFDFTLTWEHDIAATDAAVSDNASTIRDALKRQLGLELKPSHAPIEFLLVDHVEHPTDN